MTSQNAHKIIWCTLCCCRWRVGGCFVLVVHTTNSNHSFDAGHQNGRATEPLSIRSPDLVNPARLPRHDSDQYRENWPSLAQLTVAQCHPFCSAPPVWVRHVESCASRAHRCSCRGTYTAARSAPFSCAVIGSWIRHHIVYRFIHFIFAKYLKSQFLDCFENIDFRFALQALHYQIEAYESARPSHSCAAVHHNWRVTRTLLCLDFLHKVDQMIGIFGAAMIGPFFEKEVYHLLLKAVFLINDRKLCAIVDLKGFLTPDCDANTAHVIRIILMAFDLYGVGHIYKI